MKPRVLIPVALGTNRDGDLAHAFALAGAETETVPLTALRPAFSTGTPASSIRPRPNMSILASHSRSQHFGSILPQCGRVPP